MLTALPALPIRRATLILASVALVSAHRLITALAVIGLLIVLTSCSDAGAGASAAGTADSLATLAVATEQVHAEVMPVTVEATGTVRARQEAVVSAQSGGLATREVLVEEGDRVTAGQVIARLDDRSLRAQVAEQQAVIASAEATRDAADQAAGRAKSLQARKAVSDQTAEERIATARTAAAAVQQARAVLDRLNIGLAQTEVQTPFAGVVSARPVVVGTTVQTGTEVARIIRDGVLEVAADVTERDLIGIRPGHGATVTDPSGGSHESVVSSVSQTVDPVTRLGTVYVELPADAPLKAGMFARLAISGASSKVLTVAEAGLVWRGGKPAVFTVDADETVSLTPVETLTHRDGRVTVTSGLSEGERVVVSGAGFLNDGDAVHVVGADASAPGIAMAETAR